MPPQGSTWAMETPSREAI